MKLHPTFDYTYHHAKSFDFEQEVVSVLEQYLEQDILAAGKNGAYEKTFAVYPNFWNGYKSPGERNLLIGEARITCVHNETGSRNYTVDYYNTTSGEKIWLEFVACDVPFLSLIGDWQVRIVNNSNDLYSSFECTGQALSVQDGMQIRNKVNNRLSIVAGALPLARPFVCNWAMLDALPVSLYGQEGSNISDCFAMIEDLERVCPSNHLLYLESREFIVGAKPVMLRGYCLYGNGNPPSYWWIDGKGNVVLMSTIFQTFVLRQCTGGPKG